MEKTNGHSERSRGLRKETKYFDYLCDVVGRTYEYSMLLVHLHELEFYSFVPNDHNRGADGEYLRELYCGDGRWAPHGVSSLPSSGCTMLEMLIGVASRLEFALYLSDWERSIGGWFWILVENLGLEWCDDVDWRPELVDKKVEVFLARTYRSNGDGGLFPLRNPRLDQRKVEIWDQMNAWRMENYPV